MEWTAKWIWSHDVLDSINCYLAARKSFEVLDDLVHAYLHISVDSRYILYLNGVRLGHGPARSWPHKQQYDTYDVTERLKSGTNTIAVFAQHYGVSTFQYVKGRPGLLVQLTMENVSGEKECVISDKTWKVVEHPAYARNTPRMSVQRAYTEIFDARKDMCDWNKPDFDDVDWKDAEELGAVGIGPWVQLEPRSIPFLTEEPVYPTCVIGRRVVRPISHIYSFDLRWIFDTEDFTANKKMICGFVVGVLNNPSDIDATVKFLQCGSIWDRIKINGKPVGFVDDVLQATLPPGDSLFLGELSGQWHMLEYSLGLDSSSGVSFKLLPSDEVSARFAIVKCDEVDDALYKRVSSADSMCWLEGILEDAYMFPISDEHEAHVFGITTLQKEVIDAKVKTCDLDSMCTANDNVALIYPAEQDGDTEIIIDFARELSGYLEFEIEAPEGVVLDWNCFEGIQDGRILYTNGASNTLRYTTRSGHQVYRSVERHGFRYAILTVRNLRDVLRIRQVRCILSTYPVVNRGQFKCSDELLNRIWEIGRYTTRLCMEDTFVDCPGYEQAFWVGDSRNEALVNYMAFGELEIAEYCWYLAAESLHRSPVPESQVPSGWQNIIPTWSLLWVKACEEYYTYSGNRAFLRQIYPAIATTCRNFEKMLNKESLLEIEAWNMLDWAPMDTPGAGIVTHQNAWLVGAMRSTARMANILGAREDAEYFDAVGDRVRNAINRHLWSERDQAYIDSIHADGVRSEVISQQTNTVIYLCDCASDERLPIISKYVASVPEDWVTIGSPFMMFFSFEALSRLGDFETILAWTREKWGFMIEKGATTCWEMFPGFYVPGWKIDRWTRSHCHAWSAAPTFFLSAYQLGVRPLQAGFSKVLVAPEPVDLRWCKGAVPTPHGEIEVDWATQNEDFRIRVILPEAVSATVRLPAVAEKDNAPIVKGVGAQVVVLRNGRWELELDAGSTVDVSMSGVTF